MSIVSLENVSRSFRSEPLLESITLGVDPGERLGLIGANGCGKSTLLRIIAGRETIDSGRVVVARGTSIAYLAQNPEFDPDLTVLQAVFVASTETMALLRDYEEACARLAIAGEDEPALLARVADLTARLEAAGAWDLETQARTILNHLGVGDDPDALMGTLSGGQRKRVALAHALITRPDLLILDEPTNHLDTDTVAWLERYLEGYTGTLLLVTHDRYFLDRIATRTLELERGQLQSFAGGYASYLEKKQEQEAQRAAAEEKRAALIRQELAWLRRGARARSTKQKARVERAWALIDAPEDAPAARLEISMAGRRLGTRTVDMKGLSKAYEGRPVVTDFTYTLKRGDRVGIIGPNGCGKTTLLDMLSRRLEPDAGTVEWGPTVVVGYYDQESRELQEDMRVIDYIREEAELIEDATGRTVTAAQMLERFLFPGPLQYSPIGRLSGGERRRLYLLRVLMSNPNILLLDEPTNDLDIPTLMRLEDYLDSFAGCLVVVSHDRYFLDRTVDSVFRFGAEGRLREFAGNFSAAQEALEREERARDAEPPPPVKGRGARSGAPPRGSARTPAAPSPSPTSPSASGEAGPAAAAKRVRKISSWEEAEMQRLEADIETGEARRKAIEDQLAEDSSDFERTQALYEELQALQAELDRRMERWTVLAEMPR